jgi:hypothetical protein
MKKTKNTMNQVDIEYLIDLYRFTMTLHRSETDPIAQAFHYLVNEDDIAKITKSQTLFEIKDYFQQVIGINAFQDFYQQKLNKAFVKSHAEWIQKLYQWEGQATLDLAKELKLRHNYRVDLNDYDDFELIRFVAEKLIEDRPKYMYYDEFKSEYSNLVNKEMMRFLKKADRDLYAWYNYQDNIESHYVCKSAKRLEMITDGEILEIEKIIDGKHTHISFKGRISEFSNGVQLYFKLR